MASATDASEKLTITLPESSFDMYKADAPNLDVEISKEQLLDMYTKMTTMRRMEMAADGLYKAKKIRGFCHLCNGQVSYPQHSFSFVFASPLLSFRCIAGKRGRIHDKIFLSDSPHQPNHDNDSQY